MTSHMGMWRHRALLALLAAVLGFAAAAALPSAASAAPSIALTRDGTPNATIVWWTRADSPTPAYAASELRSYVKKMSGAELPVVQGTTTNAPDALASGLVVATGGAARRFEHQNSIPQDWLAAGAQKLAGARNDAFAITTVDDDKLVLSGSDQRATLYAAYELLERFGVRFFAPNFNFYEGHSEHVPHLPTVATAPLDLEQEASLRYRKTFVEEGWSHDAQNLPQLIDWMAKARQNVLVYPYDYQDAAVTRYEMFRDVTAPELAKRGLIAEVGGHGYQSWLNAEKHPQYYTSGTNVFDVQNDEAVQAYVDNVIAYLKDRPEIQIFDAWPPDGARWPAAAVAKYGSVANAEAHVVNTLNAAFHQQLPGVRVERIAYAASIAPPSPDYMYDPDVVVDFAPIGRSYAVPLNDDSAPQNARYNQYLEQWRRDFTGDIPMYEYYRKYLFHSLPTNLTHTIGADIEYESTLPLQGLGTYSEPADWIAYEFLHLLTDKLAWDTSTDVDAYLSSYLQDRYGSLADVVAPYFDQTEDAATTLWDPNSYGDLSAVSRVRDDFLAAGRTLDAVKAAAPAGSDAAFMAQRLGWNADFSLADTETSYYGLTGDAEKAFEATERTKALVHEHRFDGVVLENTYSAPRFGETVTRQSMATMYRSPAFGSVAPDDEIAVSRGSSTSVAVQAQDVDYTGHTVSWTASAPDGLRVTPGGGSLEVHGAGVASGQVSVTADDDLPDGRYTLTFHFRTEDGTQLPDATLAVVVASPGNLEPYYDNVGITDDGDPDPGNIDLFGCSYSAQALANVGIAPGQPITHDGVTFTWPDVPAGAPDNIVADRQPIAMPDGTSGARLAFLGTGAPGNAQSTGWIDYADGTRQYYTIGLPDWQKNDGDGKPAVTGYQDVAAMPYHNCGRYDGHKATYLLMTTVPLQPGKEVADVRLPYDSGRADLHFFDVQVSD